MFFFFSRILSKQATFRPCRPDEEVPPTKAVQLLAARFKSASRHRVATVLMVDELDYLVTRKQTVLYNLFEWPLMRNARLVVVGIANTMDLPERLLPKIKSRIGLSSVVFPAYIRSQVRRHGTAPRRVVLRPGSPVPARQIETIVKARLEGLPAFQGSAVGLAAAKAAMMSGDVRRALGVCLRAAQLVGAQVRAGKRHPKPAMVIVDDIQRAAEELTSSQHMVAMRGASPWERGVLVCLARYLKGNSTDEAPVRPVYERFRNLRQWMKSEDLDPPTMSETLEVLRRLAAIRLVELDDSDVTGSARVRLTTSVDDVLMALHDDNLYSDLVRQ